MKYLVFTILTLVMGDASAKTEARKISIEVTESGFEPSYIDVLPGTEVVLEVTRRTDQTCSTEVQIPSKGIDKTALPLNKTVTISWET